ncbi:MAG: hypothetical protein ACU83O_00680 [Gammaproteobacteria bacterium]
MFKKLMAWVAQNPIIETDRFHLNSGHRPGRSQRFKGMTLTLEAADVKNSLLWLPLAAMLTGCQTAATIKLPEAAMMNMHTVLVVPVESPPLEVYPDLLETRMPVYRHFDNMAIQWPVEEKIYWNPGGIMVAGNVVLGDDVAEAIVNATDLADPQSDSWSPTQELSTAAATYLNGSRIKAELYPQLHPLPIASKDRNANLAHWHGAVERWYEQNTSATDYPQTAAEPLDAVLEVGIGHYRIFGGQTSLQVFIKLVNPKTRQVIAKTGKKTWVLDGSAQSLLYPEGERFKSLIRKRGAELLAQGFQDIGLTASRQPGIAVN